MADIENQTSVVTATSASNSPQVSSSPINKKEKKAKNPRTKPSHPPTSEMVNNAIKGLKERGGSSLQAIKKYIAANYKVDAEKVAPFIKKYLKASVVSGSLVQTKGKGASGSFKLASATSTGGTSAKTNAIDKKKKKTAASTTGVTKSKKIVTAAKRNAIIGGGVDKSKSIKKSNKGKKTTGTAAAASLKTSTTTTTPITDKKGVKVAKKTDKKSSAKGGVAAAAAASNTASAASSEIKTKNPTKAKKS
ncbi:histone H1-like, partial [Diorhabda carinulata]